MENFIEEETLRTILDENASINDLIFFFMVQTSAVVATFIEQNKNRENEAEMIDRLVQDEFRKSLRLATTRGSTAYRFFKAIEPSCKPLCLYVKIENLVKLYLIPDILRIYEIQEAAQPQNDKSMDTQLEFIDKYLLFKTYATDFLKYLFFSNHKDGDLVACSDTCMVNTIDEVIENYTSNQ